MKTTARTTAPRITAFNGVISLKRAFYLLLSLNVLSKPLFSSLTPLNGLIRAFPA
ncbi:MAG: hypothetical protein ACFFD4_19270 [Candidatus Odinarchaeota archaeon]